MCAEKFPLVSMGGRAEGLASADPGARTPIGASGNLLMCCVRKVCFLLLHSSEVCALNFTNSVWILIIQFSETRNFRCNTNLEDSFIYYFLFCNHKTGLLSFLYICRKYPDVIPSLVQHGFLGISSFKIESHLLLIQAMKIHISKITEVDR